MALGDSVAVFVPVLFLLIVELANITRDTVELPNLAKVNPDPIAIYGKSKLFGHYPINERRTLFGYTIFPNLGRFLFIHWGSMMLLSMTAFVALTFIDGILQAGLLFATAVLIYLYPIFEISEYDDLLLTSSFPESFTNHLKYVSVILVLILSAPSVLFLLEALGVGLIGQFYLALVFIGTPFLAARSFTIRLKDELMRKS